MSGIDFFGDVHAQGDRLEKLVRIMGYEGPNYTHPDGRKAYFVGDLNDRGSQHAKTFDIVRRMGAKIFLGNHEFNSICYSMEGVREHIRPHTAPNEADQADFFREFPYGSEAYREVIDWFKTFPVYENSKDFKVVHACWHQNSIDICTPFLRKDKSLKAMAYKAYDQEKPVKFMRALEILIKGADWKLPRGVQYEDGQGHPRKNARLLWGKTADTPIEDLLHHGRQVLPFLSNEDKKAVFKLRNKFNNASKVPVFYGHYHLWQKPDIISPNSVCLNFKDRLVAYRWNEGDKGESSDRLFSL